MRESAGRDFCCLNPKCPLYLQYSTAELTVTARYGPGKARRMLRCSKCGFRFSERKKQAMFHARISPETVISILGCIRDGHGIRQTAKRCGVHPNTVTRYKRLVTKLPRHAWRSVPGLENYLD